MRAALGSLFVLLPFSRYYSFQTNTRTSNSLSSNYHDTLCYTFPLNSQNNQLCTFIRIYVWLGYLSGKLRLFCPKASTSSPTWETCWNMVSEDPTAPEDRDGACVLQPLCFSKKRSDIFFSLELLCSGIIFGLFNNLSTVFNAKNLHDQGYELAAGLSLFFLVFNDN